MNMTPIKQKSVKRGFTLAESVIALGILVVLITGFLAVFGPAATAIRKTLSAQEASRLQASLEQELSNLRPGVQTKQYKDSFEKAFEWISRSHEQGNTILIYNYRADPAETRDDGSFQPEDDVNGVAGEDYLIQSMVRRINDPLLEEDFEAIVGRVFFVKLTQLIFKDEALQVAEEEGTIVDPFSGDGDFTTTSSEFPSASILVEAQFFTLPTRSFAYVTGPFDPENFTRPIFRRNLGLLR
ncbi:MAG: type II secretion system protein [Verrucomicrobiaceae bacterium]